MRREALRGRQARTIEQLLGLQPWSLLAVERRANGDFALTFRHQEVAGRHVRAMRFPFRRIAGYRPRRPWARPRDLRARRRRNAKLFACWLWFRLDLGAPVCVRALEHGEPQAVEELREAILSLTPPDAVVFVWERRAA